MPDYSVFEKTALVDQTVNQAFLDGPVLISRYDKQKYVWLEKLIKQQISFFWTPEEIDIFKDAKDFKSLAPHEQHIFTSNLKRQILLDSIQGRAPILAFGPICSIPELETWLTTWSFFESIHSRSYTYLIQNVYPNPSIVFDELTTIKEISDCAFDVSKHYDDLIYMNNSYHTDEPIDRFDHKKAIWLALMSVNILEGIRFYVSFAASWAFAEAKKMEGNAKIIKFISRDENLHLAGTQQLLKSLVQDDPDFATIKKQTEMDCIAMFIAAAEQEKGWIKYMFKDGSIIGLNERILTDYIEWLTNRRMVAVGYKPYYKTVASNPLPWTQKWIGGAEVQVAPQETEIVSYTTGSIKQDVSVDSFKGMKL